MRVKAWPVFNGRNEIRSGGRGELEFDYYSKTLNVLVC